MTGVGGFDVFLPGRRVHFDDAAHSASQPTARHGLKAALDAVLHEACIRSSHRDILRTMASIAGANSLFRHYAATRLMVGLFSQDSRGLRTSRLAILVVSIGLMDAQNYKHSIILRFILCLSGVCIKNSDISNVPELLEAISLQLISNRQLTKSINPTIMGVIATFCRLASPSIDLNPRLVDMCTLAHGDRNDISWPLALRFGLFLSQTSDRCSLTKADLWRAIVATGLAAGLRDRNHRQNELLERAQAASPQMFAIALQVELEDDPTGFREQSANSQYHCRRVSPPAPTDVVLVDKIRH